MHKLFQVQFSPITPGYGLFELLPCNIFAKTAIRYIQGLPEARLLKSVVVPFWKGRAELPAEHDLYTEQAVLIGNRTHRAGFFCDVTDGLKSDAVSFNRLMEEKAGHLYAVCLLPDAKARRRAGLTAPARAQCRPVPSARC